MAASDSTLPPAPPLTPREFARLLPEVTGEAAIRAGGIPTVVVAPGDWRPAGLRRRRQVSVVAEGLVAWRTAVVGGQSVVLTGPGDVLLPHGDPAGGPVPGALSWRPLTHLRLAVIEERVLAAAGAELTEALLAARGRAAALQSLLTAATRIGRMDRRLLTILWLLAGRWGHADEEGLHADLPLTQSTLALVAGAHAGTVEDTLAAMLTEGRIRLDGDRLLLPQAQAQALQRAHMGLADGEAALERAFPTAGTG